MYIEPLISIENLSHTFGKGEAARTVLNSVSVDFYPGEIVIIVGPSGAGKTTILTLAGALRSLQVGSVRVAGIELNGAPAKRQLATRQNIGYIFQHHNLLESLNVRENVQMGLAHQPEIPISQLRLRALDILDRVGLVDHAEKHPSQLSGGQRQRVAIARALVRNPAIILADEPTAALDSHSGREVVALLQRMAREQGCAILLVTHDNRILDVADRVLTLEDGRIEESNRTLERIRTGLLAAIRDIAQYPSLYLSQPIIGPKQTAHDSLAGWHQQSMSIAARKLVPHLAEDVACLVAVADQLRQVECATRQFLELFVKLGLGESRDAADSMLQSLEFLLITAADATLSSNHAELLVLAELTSGRGEVMVSLRNRFRNGPDGVGVMDEGALLGLTFIFARIAYFLHEFATLWPATQSH